MKPLLQEKREEEDSVMEEEDNVREAARFNF